MRIGTKILLLMLLITVGTSAARATSSRWAGRSSTRLCLRLRTR